MPVRFPKFVSESAAMYHELRKSGTSHDKVGSTRTEIQGSPDVNLPHAISYAASIGRPT